MRALDALAPQDLGLLHVTSRLPFWSPDGRTIGFSMAGAINTIPAGGGPIRQVCKVPAIGRTLDVAWRLDGTIVFAVARDSVYTVPAEGGTPTVYLAVDPKTEIEFTSVSPLPDNRVIVTTRLRDPPLYRTELVGSGTRSSTDDDHRRPRRDVRQVRSARRAAVQTAGAERRHLGRALRRRARESGEGCADCASRHVFPGGRHRRRADPSPPPAAIAELVWLSQAGEVSPVPGTPVSVGSAPVMSPDGSRAAFVVDTEGDRHLVVRDLKTGNDTRLTPAGQDVPTLNPPSWFPSGDEVVFGTGPIGARRIVARRVDGSGGQRMLVGGRLGQVTPDSRYLVFLVEEGGTNRLRYAPLLADGSVGAAQRMLKQSDPDIESFHLSPDGSTLVYATPEADGLLNAFLTDFPAGARQVQATTIGAGSPRFSKDGTTIFYGSQAVPRGIPHEAH